MDMMKRIPVELQDPEIRKNNFNEVSLGYNKAEAIAEATRCLQCKNKPCVGGCPVAIDIPAFILKIKEEKFEEAYQIIKKSSNLSAVCGRVCPQEIQCEKRCIRGIKGEAIAIGRLERFVSDYHYQNSVTKKVEMPKKDKVAIIGSGPSGLACAGVLAKQGYRVTIFEALHKSGGVLIYGIPEFRLPKSIVNTEIQNLINMGVEIKTNTVIGKTLTLDNLKEDGYKAVFIGSGAGTPRFMGIPGENLNGVFSANEFLTRINLMQAYKEDSDTPLLSMKKVVVVGGGNVAMDSARCAMRVDTENVTLVYRRSMEELPARSEEVGHAQEEGIDFRLLVNPVEIIGDENHRVKAIKCIRMELGEPDNSGRCRPVPIKDSLFEIECDAVIMAIGTSPNSTFSSTVPDLKMNNRGGIVVDENGQTSIKGVFAGGDAVTGSATVILAMGAGKNAAKNIIKYLEKK